MLVFRSAAPQPEPDMPRGVTFEIVRTVSEAIGLAPAYMRRYGAIGTLKMIAKIASSKRFYYAARQEGIIISEGWILAGWCSSYDIGARDYVIGPIATLPSERGRGLAHLCLVRAINFCLMRSAEWVYIDTTEDNHASRRAIEKSGMKIFARLTN